MIDLDNFQELLRQGRSADIQDRARADAFAVMMRSEGWRLYVELIDSRIQMFSDVLLQPLESLDRAGLQEYVKGAMYAFVLMRDLPSVTVSAMGRRIGEESES